MYLLAIVFSFLVLPEDKGFLALLDHLTKRAFVDFIQQMDLERSVDLFDMDDSGIHAVSLGPTANAVIVPIYSGVQICPSYLTDTTPGTRPKSAVP